MESFWHDLRFGVKLAVARPGFTAVTVLTLALGIGPNTAVFSVVHTVLLTPPPYADPASILTTPAPQQPRPGSPQVAALSTDDVQDWRQQSRTVQLIALYMPDTLTLTGRGDPERLSGARVSPALFPLLGVEPLRGRPFTDAEENPAAAPVVLLSYTTWERRFGSDPSIVGKPIELDAVGRQVVGIMPPSFEFPNREVEYWAPLALTPPQRSGNERRVAVVPIVVRLKRGATRTQAEAEANAILRRSQTQALTAAMDQRVGLRLIPLQERQSGPIRPALLVLWAAVGFLLLTACANVASLLLSRTASRRHELAVRAALGAGRGRLIRQMLTEGAMLSLLGGIVGVLLAAWMLFVLARLAPPELLASGRPALNLVVLAFAAGISLVTSALFGLAPALAVLAGDVRRWLTEGGREAVGLRLFGRNWLRNLLTITQVALAILLLVGTGLFTRSLAELLRQHPGYQPAGTLAVQLSLPRARYPQPQSRIAFYDQLLAGVRSSPGVRAVGLTNQMPMSRARISLGFGLPGDGAGTDAAPQRTAGVRLVSPAYFKAMGTRLVAGRDFSGQDRETTELVVTVNTAFADRFFPGTSPVGRQIDIGGSRQIVGVFESMKPQGLDSDPQPEIFMPYTQFNLLLLLDGPAAAWTVVVRAAGDPMTLVPVVRTQVARLDRQLPIYGVTTLDRRLAESVAQPRFFATVLAIFAALALGLAGIGIYGVLASQVAQATREIGIQMALGAGHARIRRAVLAQGAGLTAIGLATGLLGAWGLSQFIASLLFVVKPFDLTAYVGASAILALAALAGSYVPARRATAVDPVVALRWE